MGLKYKSFKAQDGADIFFVEQGEGRPLVYLLGFLDTIETSQALLARWSRQFRCIMFDYRGFGKTPATNVGGIEQSARDLHDLLVYLDLKDVALVGYSMGGSVSFSYFSQFGDERIGRLALVDTTPKVINENGWNLGLRQGRYSRDDFEHDLRSICENPPLFHMNFYLHAATLSRPEAYPAFPSRDDVGGWLAAVMAKTGLAERFARRVFFKETDRAQRELEETFWTSMAGGDWRSTLANINVLTLCLYADPGSCYSPLVGRRLVAEIPNATLETIPEATHHFVRDKFCEFVTMIDEFCSPS
jgi:non-heme chloroperoxidase